MNLFIHQNEGGELETSNSYNACMLGISYMNLAVMMLCNALSVSKQKLN